MKVYERFIEDRFDYPEDMSIIIKYLKSRGKILVSYSTIEELYRDFSEDKYCAGWMTVNGDILEEFEEWLHEYEM